MKVVVLGAGVIGVCTAYHLAQDGHEVTVIERQPEAGRETSFANAGQVSPGYSSPWAVPHMLRKLARWLVMEHAPVVLHPTTDLATLRWLMAWLGNCNSAAYARNKGRMVRLSQYSLDCLKEIRGATAIAYDQRARGTVQLYRHPAQLAKIAQDTPVLDRFGVRYAVLDRAGCLAAEPGLAQAGTPIAGGLHLLDDETGDCFKFTSELAQVSRRLGVKFAYEMTVEHLVTEADRVTGLRLRETTPAPQASPPSHLISADAVVVALGSYTPLLLKPLGIRVPVQPVKGYSMTLPITDFETAPLSTVTDETYKVCITRLGDRIRLAGTAEIAGSDASSIPDERKATLIHSYTDLFPNTGDLLQASYWTCLRPMTPDNAPIIGRAGNFANLWLNSGHGTLGWTMAAGAGRLLADLLTGRTPDIDPTDYRLHR